MCRIDIYSMRCTMMETRMNSITRKGKLEHGVTGSSSQIPQHMIKLKRG